MFIGKIIKFKSRSHETQSLKMFIVCLKCAKTYLQVSIATKKIFPGASPPGPPRDGEGMEIKGREGKGLEAGKGGKGKEEGREGRE